MQQPLTIAGVGEGTQECRWEGEIPICVENGTEQQVHRFDAPIVQGTGEDLPLILGLKSIEEKEGVIQTRKGWKMISFPGPGGYEIKWSPGTQHIELMSAPSGHMLIPLGDFTRVAPQTGGVPDEPRILHATGEAPTSDARSSGEPAPTSV